MSSFLTDQTFQAKIEDMVRESRLSYMDAVLLFCKENDLEPDEIKKLVNANLKDKIRLAAQEDGYLAKTATLPI